MKNSNLGLKNLIQQFKLSRQAEGRSPKTIEWYTSFLERFYRFLRESHLPVLKSGIRRRGRVLITIRQDGVAADCDAFVRA